MSCEEQGLLPPLPVREIENCWIPLSDGCRLAARIWLPENAETAPVPAILEYLPYRKRDGTSARDALTHPFFAGHGYAAVRVDMRGNGESDGLMWDEYLQQEQDDALEVLEWITSQSWCAGTVGMIGISWGGFNGLQVAARKPAALKAVVAVCFTDDRYADDIHYKGGCLLNENLGWATTMLSLSSRPPDPALVGEAWRAIWMRRLENMPLLVETWLNHQGRDAYWQHGSVCEDYNAIDAAVLAVGGWGDAYSNAVPRLLQGLRSPAQGLIGPWVHMYPHFAEPAPSIGFLHECLRWWDHWLKGKDSGVMEQPRFRAYMMNSAAPQTHYDERPGRWISQATWPTTEDAALCFSLTSEGALRLGNEMPGDPTMTSVLSHSSAQDTGASCGEYCAMWGGPEWPGDQRDDDARSLCFDGPLLESPLEVLGAPVLELELSADRPQGLLAVRLCDVAPDGCSTRITYGILNLTQRDGPATPKPLVPDETYKLRLQLDDVAYALQPGHRLRLAISTSYWPLIWPSPEQATISLALGASRLLLPQVQPGEADAPAFDPAETLAPEPVEVLRSARSERHVTRDLASGTLIMDIFDDAGDTKILAHGLEHGSSCRERYSIDPKDPLSATADCAWTRPSAVGIGACARR